jgi:TonB family protein
MDPLSLALKSTLLLATAALACQCLRRQSAATRHLVWLLALGALPLLPLLSRSLPAFSIVAPGPIFSTTVTASGATQRGLPPAPAAFSLDLFTIWALGAAFLLLHLGASLFLLRRLRQRATGRHPILRTISPGAMPLTFGHFRPLILLPAEAASWPAARRRHVVLHEIAHIRRHDFASHLFARCVLAVYWWQPLAWYAWRQMTTEREVAADDLVLHRGVRPSEYAQSLLSVAAAHSPAGLAIAMARPLPLESRLQSILSARTVRAAPGKLATSLAALGLAAAILPLATLRAQAPVANPPALTQGIDALRRQSYEEAIQRFAELEPARAALWQAITRERQGLAAAAAERFELAASLYAGNDAAQLVALQLYARFLSTQPGAEASLVAVQARQAPISARLRAASPSPEPSASLRRVGGTVSKPKLLAKEEPLYSEEARAARLQGSVVVFVEISPAGIPENIRVLRGLGLGLDESAREAVAKWRFEPGQENGQPVAVMATIEVHFRLL